MLFPWTFPALFVVLTVLYLLFNAWARSRSSGPPSPTRWWLVFAVITIGAFCMAAVIELVATIGVLLITGSFLLGS